MLVCTFVSSSIACWLLLDLIGTFRVVCRCVRPSLEVCPGTTNVKCGGMIQVDLPANRFCCSLWFMVSTRKQIEDSGEELVGPLISEKALRQKKKKAIVEGEGTDAKIASLAQQMEKMTLMMANLVKDLARKSQDEIYEDSRRKTSRTKTSKVKKRVQFSEEEDSNEEEH
ncbi:unnamed protein product [Prunus armeniaca]